MTDVPTLRALRARAVNVPMHRPLAVATGAVTHAPLVLVDLETDQEAATAVYHLIQGCCLGLHSQHSQD